VRDGGERESDKRSFGFRQCEIHLCVKMLVKDFRLWGLSCRPVLFG
jgi:hypothetical protein